MELRRQVVIESVDEPGDDPAMRAARALFGAVDVGITRRLYRRAGSFIESVTIILSGEFGSRVLGGRVDIIQRTGKQVMEHIRPDITVGHPFDLV